MKPAEGNDVNVGNLGAVLINVISDRTELGRIPMDVLVNLRRQVRHLDADIDAAFSQRMLYAGTAAAQLLPDRLAVSTAEAGRLLGLDEQAVRALCRAGTIPSRKLGREYRITTDALRTLFAFEKPARIDTIVSSKLTSSRDAGAITTAPQEPRTYAVEIRRSTRNPQDHGGEVGGRNPRHERDDPSSVEAAGGTGDQGNYPPGGQEGSKTLKLKAGRS